MHMLTPFEKAERRFPKEGLAWPVVSAMSQYDFVDYCIEQLWDKLAAEKGKQFDDLSPTEQMDIDFMATLKVAVAMDSVCRAG